MTTKVTDEPVPGGRRPTMVDVARQAGVSLKTVSRVLNGESGVRPATAEAVEQAARELRFRRNESAAMLRRSGGRTHSVGLVIEDVSNPYYATLTKAIEDVTRANGFLLVTASSHGDVEDERQIVRDLCARRVEGLLIVPSNGDLAYLADELEHGTVVVSIDRPARGINVDTVTVANAEGVRDAVSRLAAIGHRRIGFIGDTAHHTGDERMKGYRNALRKAGIRADRRYVHRVHDVVAAREAAQQLLALDEPPTAIFAGNNLLTRGVLEALGARRSSIALVGFDDFAFADLLQPAVSVVNHDVTALGRLAAEQLLRRLGGEDSPHQQIVLSTSLIERGSGEIRPTLSR